MGFPVPTKDELLKTEMPVRNCELCGQPVDRPDEHYQWTTGWTRHRAQGGTNALRMRHVEERFAHTVCVEQAHLKGHGSLF